MPNCPNCGAHGEGEFCAYCGTPLAEEPVPQQQAYQQEPVQSYAPPQQTYQQPHQQPYSSQPYPPPYNVSYVEAEPEVGWWKLVLAVVFFILAWFTCFTIFLALIFGVWFVLDWGKWYQWNERRKRGQYGM